MTTYSINRKVQKHANFSLLIRDVKELVKEMELTSTYVIFRHGEAITEIAVLKLTHLQNNTQHKYSITKVQTYNTFKHHIKSNIYNYMNF